MAAPAAAAAAAGAESWLPVESNPEAFNAYAAKLGLDTTAVRFVDVMSTEAWALDMIPRPVLAVLMLFPVKAASEAHRAAEEAARVAPGAVAAPASFFVSQTIPQACGTIALVHAVATCSSQTGGALSLSPASWFHSFVQAQQAASPAERCAAMAADAQLEAAHGEAVHAGQSAVVDEAHEHFACFVERSGQLVELDGRKAAPIAHGPTSPASLLEDVVRVVQGFVSAPARAHAHARTRACACAQGGIACLRASARRTRTCALARAYPRHVSHAHSDRTLLRLARVRRWRATRASSALRCLHSRPPRTTSEGLARGRAESGECTFMGGDYALSLAGRTSPVAPALKALGG
jgi:ubiquitin carboxyl-terminal hydrolase L3